MARAPCVKFAAQAYSYMLFLGLIFTHSAFEQDRLCHTRLLSDPTINDHWLSYSANLTHISSLGNVCVRSHRLRVLEMCMIIYLVGR